MIKLIKGWGSSGFTYLPSRTLDLKLDTEWNVPKHTLSLSFLMKVIRVMRKDRFI